MLSLYFLLALLRDLQCVGWEGGGGGGGLLVPKKCYFNPIFNRVRALFVY